MTSICSVCSRPVANHPGKEVCAGGKAMEPPRLDHPWELWAMRHFGLLYLLLVEDITLIDRYRWVRDNSDLLARRVVDAGCGYGLLVLWAAKAGIPQALGLNFEREANFRAMSRADAMGLKAEFLTADLRHLDEMKLEKVDEVICTEAIEHIFNDDKLVHDLAALLNPGGRLVLTTPPKPVPTWAKAPLSQVEDGGHVREGYTEEELRRLFVHNGLEVAKVEFISGVVSQALLRWRWKLARHVGSSMAAVVTAPFRVLMPLDGPLSRRPGTRFFSIAIVGKKPGARPSA